MADLLRFGSFELEIRAGRLHNKGRIVRLAPQPFNWDGDTFIDFEQSVNFTVKQVREALNDNAVRAIYVETVPKRGYRFIAPVDDGGAASHPCAEWDGRNHGQAAWTNVAELRMQDEHRKARRRIVMIASAVTVALAAVGALIFWIVR